MMLLLCFINRKERKDREGMMSILSTFVPFAPSWVNTMFIIGEQ
jgi:hypothetical protein